MMGVFRGMAGLFDHGALDIWQWLHPKAISIGDFGDYVFFKIILDHLEKQINHLGVDILDRMMGVISIIAVAALTLWIMIQGYRMLSGQMRESAPALVISTAKAVIIVGAAVSFSLFNQPLTNFLTNDLRNQITYIVTGSTDNPADQIDENLGWMQVAMTSVDMLDTAGDPGLSDEKSQTKLAIGIGSGGPAIVGGAMLLMYQVAMALFIGFGPLFILCLLFDFTKSLFQRWLFYGIGTLFSMAVLAAMTSIALDMVSKVAEAMWASSIAGNILLNENTVGGYSSQAMQQGGMGLILTTLILTVPPMAAGFFQGTLGTFGGYAMMGAQLGRGPRSAPNGPSQSMGWGGGGGHAPGRDTERPQGMANTGDFGSNLSNGVAMRAVAAGAGRNAAGGQTTMTQDVPKQGSALRESGGAASSNNPGATAGPATNGGSSQVAPEYLVQSGNSLQASVPPELQQGPKSYGPGATSGSGSSGSASVPSPASAPSSVGGGSSSSSVPPPNPTASSGSPAPQPSTSTTQPPPPPPKDPTPRSS